MTKFLSILKIPLRRLWYLYKGFVNNIFLLRRIKKMKNINYDEISFKDFSKSVENFMCHNNPKNDKILYNFSSNSENTSLYGSVYACLIKGLLNLDLDKKRETADYFDSFQNKNDGLFYDPKVNSEIYSDSDWWGARHLALHVILAYEILGFKPKYQFKFLYKYYEQGYVTNWINSFDFNSYSLSTTDIDNKIMNIGGLLQYQRDYFQDENAEKSLNELKIVLLEKINSNTGMWGYFDKDDENSRSRMVQFSYHLFPIFFYDDYYQFDHEKIVSNVLKTQNSFGGYGIQRNSSACEDIDSIDILLRFYPYVNEESKKLIDNSIDRAIQWIFVNKVNDGGFSFKLNENHIFGDSMFYTTKNKSSMFSTWFRILSIGYIDRWLGNKNFNLLDMPGYMPALKNHKK